MFAFLYFREDTKEIMFVPTTLEKIFQVYVMRKRIFKKKYPPKNEPEPEPLQMPPTTYHHMFVKKYLQIVHL